VSANQPTSFEKAAQPQASNSRLNFMWLSLLGLITIGLYLPVFGYDFVNWDDTWYVVKNPYLTSWSPSNLWDISTDVINRNYAPVTIFTYLVEYTCWGLNPSGYHIVNIVLHATNAVLVCVLVSQLTNRRTVGWMTAALFAVHPIQIESVAWISSMKGLLCATFTLACLICWMRPTRTERQSNWGLAFFVLALLSKALTVVVPAIILLYDMLVCRKKFSDALARQFVPGILALWLLIKTMAAQGASTGGIRTHLALSKLQILGIDSVILWDYVRMLFWPSQLSVLYNPATTGLGWQIAFATAAWFAIGFMLWKIRKTHPLVTVACVAWLLLLLPVLNLTPITTLMNDRYLYMPAIPFFGLVCFAIHSAATGLARRYSKLSLLDRQQAWLAIPCVAVVALAVATRQHLPVWKNDQALWEHAVTQTPELPVVRIQYAMMLHEQGRDGLAIAQLQETLATCHPDDIDRSRIQKKIEAWKNGDKEAGAVQTWIIREARENKPERGTYVR
jgi:protein O-mannosyl-transferase